MRKGYWEVSVLRQALPSSTAHLEDVFILVFARTTGEQTHIREPCASFSPTPGAVLGSPQGMDASSLLDFFPRLSPQPLQAEAQLLVVAIVVGFRVVEAAEREAEVAQGWL